MMRRMATDSERLLPDWVRSAPGMVSGRKLRLRLRVVWLVLGAGLLLTACEFDPQVPFPEEGQGVAVGVRPEIAYGGPLGSFRVDLHGTGVTEDQLLDLARALRSSIAPTDGAVVVNRSGTSEDRTWLVATQASAWVPGIEDSIDAPAIAAAADSLGLDLRYLHWCPPREYEILSTSPASHPTDPAYGCLLWNPEIGFEVTQLTLQSERGALATNLVIFLVGLVGGLWAISEFAIAAIRRRRVRWSAVGRGLALWAGLYVLYVMVMTLIIPDPLAILEIEPASSDLGRFVDGLASVVTWSAIGAGLIAIVLALATALGLAVVGVSRRLRRIG